MHIGKVEFTLQILALFILDDLRCIRIDPIDGHILQRVGHVHIRVLTQWLAQSERQTRFGLVKTIRQEEQVAIEQACRERQLLPQEPRLRQRHAEIAALKTKSRIQVEALTRTPKARPIRDVKVGLREVHETHQTIDRTETCAKVDRSRGFFDHVDIHILKPFGPCINGSHVHLTEIVHVVQTVFPRLHFHRVQLLTRSERQFPANHPVLRHRVPGDIHFLNEGLRPFSDAIKNLHLTRTTGQNAGFNTRISVTARPIVILDHLLIRFHLRTRIRESRLSHNPR